MFDPTTDALLAFVSDDIDPDYFANRTFAFLPEAARMRAVLGEVDEDGLAEFTTFEAGSGAELQRQTFVEATLGVLLERQATWGPLFNHPRTIVIGPAASFQCDVSRFGILQNKWEEEPKLQVEEGNRVFPKDVDQIVWVNLCPKDFSGLRARGAAWSLVEIGVLRFHHEERTGAQAPISVGGARFYSGEGSGEGLYKPMEKRAEMKKLTELLFGEGEGREGLELEVVVPDDEYYGKGADDVLSHVQAAAVVLERLMRDRTTPLGELLRYKTESTKVQNQTGLVYKAVISGQMPYAEKDLGGATRQPDVMPGEFTISRIADVMGNVVSRTRPKRIRRTEASFPNASGEPTVSADDTLSPLSGSDVENFL